MASYGSTLSLLRSAALFVLVLLLGCDDAALGPERRGTIRGTVRDAETQDPVVQANVTTSPPTQSVLTGSDGRFELDGVEAGNYSITASKSGYDDRATSVRVGESETTRAEILLQRSEGAGPQRDSLDAEVTAWFNDAVNLDESGADSTFVDVEYRARNAGTTTLTEYEIYFTIQTTENTFSYEAAGDTLAPGQSDLGGFRKYVRDEANRVAVRDVYVEAE